MIETRSTDIEQTIEEVKHLTRSAEAGRVPTGPVDVAGSVDRTVARVRERHPEADVSVAVPRDGLAVRANERLDRVVEHLVENAVVHADDAPAVEVSATRTPHNVRLSVTDDGPGLPERQQALLETGDIGDFDNPGTGFGLNVVRLLVEDYGGRIETEVGGDGTTVTVVLPRAETDTPGIREDRSSLVGVRPDRPQLVVALAAALVAGVCYGVASEALGGSVAGIGVFYGTEDPVVGWITHEFHSVVFGFVYLGLLALVPERHRGDPATYVAVGTGWGVVLWVVAASFVAPVWLRLVGIPAPVPNVSVTFLVTHLVWGVSLGALTAVGNEYVIPWTDRDAA